MRRATSTTASRPSTWAVVATALVTVLVATLTGCTSSPSGQGAATDSSAAPAGSTDAAPTTRDRLAVLRVEDRPSPTTPYRRDDWSHWDDVDGNGCDARQDTLLAWSGAEPTLDPDRRCKVVAGDWVLPFDGTRTASPSDIEVDHLVPLAEAHRSGGWRWDPGLRRRFANDPLELVPASSPANRTKSDSTPDEWRPSRPESWCAYADRYVAVKATYELTVTTEERDALGQMLDTCTSGSEVWPGGR